MIDPKLTEERKKRLKRFLEKYNGAYTLHSPKPLLEVVQFLQSLLEFSFTIDSYDKTPKIILGEEKDEEDNTKTREYKQPLLFIKLLKRGYAPVDDDSRKLFKNSEVLLASTPTMYSTCQDEVENPDGTKNSLIYKTGFFYSDNEFILTLKTKNLMEQYNIINTLEKTFNIYAKHFFHTLILASGITKIECKELKDKDDLKTANIYFQLRLKEIVKFDDTYLLKAFNIFAGLSEDEKLFIDGSENNFIPNKNIGKFPETKKNNKIAKEQLETIDFNLFIEH